MRYCVIEDGVVTGAIEADEGFVLDYEKLCIRSDTAHTGDKWDGKQFIEAVKPSAEEPASPVNTRLRSGALKRRFTEPERTKIRAAAVANPVVFDFMDLLNSEPYVHLDNEDVVKGITLMESAAMLAKGRADVILNTPIDMSER